MEKHTGLKVTPKQQPQLCGVNSIKISFSKQFLWGSPSWGCCYLKSGESLPLSHPECRLEGSILFFWGHRILPFGSQILVSQSAGWFLGKVLVGPPWGVCTEPPSEVAGQDLQSSFEAPNLASDLYSYLVVNTGIQPSFLVPAAAEIIEWCQIISYGDLPKLTFTLASPVSRATLFHSPLGQPIGRKSINALSICP